MRLHIDKEIVTPAGLYRRGERVNVDSKTARRFIDAGYATHISIWLATIAAEEGYDLIKAKKPSKNKLAKLMDF